MSLVMRYASEFSLTLRNRHLLVPTVYDVRPSIIIGSLDMIRLALCRSRSLLLQNAKELEFVIEELLKPKEEKPNDLTWRLVPDAYEALIELRGQMGCLRGQAIIDCMVCDKAVFLAH